MTWRTIRLELARSAKFVSGDRNRGYILRAPLTKDGVLDVEKWRESKKDAVVRKFWGDEEDHIGHLIHTRHNTWAFSYEPGEDDDTPFFHLETHKLDPGEYVSIKEQNGETLTYRVVSIQ